MKRILSLAIASVFLLFSTPYVASAMDYNVLQVKADAKKDAKSKKADKKAAKKDAKKAAKTQKKK